MSFYFGIKSTDIETWFILPSLVLRRVAMCCLVEYSSGILPGVVTEGFHVECLSSYRELILRNGDEGLRRSTGRRKAECSTMVCLVPWEQG